MTTAYYRKLPTTVRVRRPRPRAIPPIGAGTEVTVDIRWSPRRPGPNGTLQVIGAGHLARPQDQENGSWDYDLMLDGWRLALPIRLRKGAWAPLGEWSGALMTHIDYVSALSPR